MSGKAFNIGKGVSRRGFLKGTGLAGLTLAATGGLAGCSSVTQTGSMFTAPGVQKTGYQYASEAEEGTWHHCACQRNCFDTCMMKVRTVGGRVVEVRGDENSPYTADALIGTATAIDADDLRRPSEAGFYAFLKELGQSEDGDLRRTIASEYAELFVGLRPPLAPLYESVYLGSPSRLFTEQTMSVRRFYERCGLSVVKDGKVPDDHIAYELELMATLAGREADELEAGHAEQALELQRLQREFLVVHLGGWASLFASRVAHAPCASFYAALSRFTQEFVREDDAYLGEAIIALEAAGDAFGHRVESVELDVEPATL